MAETPAYRQLVDQKRCVVLFNGFYEWQKLGKSDKQPYFIHLAGSPIMRIAGLFDAWRNDEGNITYTYSIITTESPPKMKWIHTRMPLILRDADEADRWLADEAADKRFKPFLSLVRPYPHDDLTYYPVTKQGSSMRSSHIFVGISVHAVGQATFDSDACMAKVDVRVAGKITSFYKQMDGPSIKKEDQAESVAPDPFIPLKTERSDCADDAALSHHVSSSPTRVSFKRPADGACPLTCMPPPDKWNCDACTFENAGDAKMCAMCDSRRELPLAEWTCATCTFANAFTTSSCSMCHASRAPRPTLTPKKPKIGESPQKPITSFFSKQ
ncbi:hypothetical protein H310_02310 [Aphanomyces invadans]|uniref:RanBP2-type domain-containing protein n=1 Tax=Aphanomyces invadans TaxID=157072 RepID=A0A024UNB9_9STRA|nr:hypothetical protein H310_02310 [Aphanomyces invadans]ETW07901.1 hypothetical protein H310_02310 [Aphanomyces invadans]|eukprot:XP_008863994.1 hypothetical protein H310_02310 [Aphanomyces invadans]